MHAAALEGARLSRKSARPFGLGGRRIGRTRSRTKDGRSARDVAHSAQGAHAAPCLDFFRDPARATSPTRNARRVFSHHNDSPKRISMRRIVTLAAAALLGLLPLAHSQNTDPLAAFREGKGWTVESAADTPIVSAPADDTEPRFLATRAELGDLVLSVDVRLENGASAAVFLLGRYPLELRADD